MSERPPLFAAPHAVPGWGAVPVETAAEVSAVLHDLASALVEARAVVEVAPLPPLVADPVVLRVALRAVLLGALASRGGMPPRISIAAEQADQDWCLAVADNGTPPEARAVTGQPSTAMSAAVARLGGRLWTEPQPDGGAIVRFTVPAPA